MPKVSIIVPNYQHANYLEQRLNSIAAQTFKDYELILLDDASTDGSLQILQKYSAKFANCQLAINSENSGSPFKQWNKGVEMATGEYLWFAESDDFADPHLLETLVPLLDQQPSIGIAYGQSMLVNEEGAPINSYSKNLKFLFKTDVWEADFHVSGAQACEDWLFFHNPIPNASGALLRKSTYLKVGGGDPTMRLNGDWYLYAKMLLESDLAFSKNQLNFFRVHAQTQRSKSRKRASVYRELIRINTLLREALPNTKVAADKAMDEFANWWIGNLPYHSFNAENRALNTKLYKEFKSYKTNLPWRIFLTFIISYLRDLLSWLKLLKPLKQIRKQLFPGKYWNQ
jgi:glycosyltransferase involved in cell wall biosynthesis